MKQSVEHALGKGKATLSGNTRTAGKEQYYTPATTASRLVEAAAGLIPNFTEHTIIEPAAGTGSFVDAFKAHGIVEVIALDIDPKRGDIARADFLGAYTFPKILTHAVCITNPPFGRNSSLSIPFFNKLADSCEYICFVIPKSWRKWSIQNRLDSRFHLIHDEELSIDYVDEVGVQLNAKGGTLNTVFQIWERREEPRIPISVPDHGILERTTPELADVALTMFGRGCGTYKTDFPREKNTTKMFLKVLKPEGYEALDQADFAQFYNNVAFVEALSLPEINYAVNEYLASVGKL